MGGNEGGQKLLEETDFYGASGLFWAFKHSGNKDTVIDVITLKYMISICGEKLMVVFILSMI